ncbi:nicotinate phosphoribosyltransferase [Meiothermus luteus]|uniref:Nicotinamide phosphoribosyltransferase n=1 Tax=Meiothermus luteus TaxID=2026184 RepID=A0A399ENQ5_9DEIN|nr:nicotinate phosphoribosyltransferase [Meiothermus luteus]RIH86344.1 nicotinate phosphoribosyltransferase [Meiothermus luteus]RMH56389.1 MAG: nicotinate phosphoribosyltransferase [Deinococcota bacterium]
MKSLNPHNLILNTDSYKASHFAQFPKGLTYASWYIESRGGDHNFVRFFGLQAFLIEYLSKGVSLADVEEAREVFLAHGLPFPYEGWRYIAQELGGRLPVRIRAVPEGMVIPVHNPLVIIESTDPKVPWLPGWLETALLRAVWYPTTVCTLSWAIRNTIKEYLEKTADDPEAELPFKLHDFGARGVSSLESAGLGGMAHLVNFQGTDTVTALVYARNYYGAEMAGYSIPAMEHSTVTSFGPEGEAQAYRQMIETFGKPGALFAMVIDSYNRERAVGQIIGEELRGLIQGSGATAVIRPDSGDPPFVVLRTVQTLEAKFGATVNKKGFKVLNGVRVIQGDGVNADTIRKVLFLLEQWGYSASNVAFGMGGALLQHPHRDTQKFAQKLHLVTVDGVTYGVGKSPVDDPSKLSKRGRLDVIKDERGIRTVELPLDEPNPHPQSLLRVVFENGEIKKRYTWEEVRANA